jgi:glycosyltransferase involved in cell wall biosynthesis
MKISIVMAYFNRREQLIRTLRSIKQTAYNDEFEAILIDDNSREEERVEDLQEEFTFLKVHRVDPKDKWYVCSCIAYNKGFTLASGDIIIIQNPECLHVLDVLSYVSKNLTNQNMLSIPCYALNKDTTKAIDTNMNYLWEWLSRFPQVAFTESIGLGWYNHLRFRPVYFHFCNAITKINLDKLGGFDERYAYGIAFDDAEIIDRIDRLCLKKIIPNPNEAVVIHQWHPKVKHFAVSDYKEKWNRNRTIYEVLTKSEDSIKKENSYA